MFPNQPAWIVKKQTNENTIIALFILIFEHIVGNNIRIEIILKPFSYR